MERRKSGRVAKRTKHLTLFGASDFAYVTVDHNGNIEDDDAPLFGSIKKKPAKQKKNETRREKSGKKRKNKSDDNNELEEKIVTQGKKRKNKVDDDNEDVEQIVTQDIETEPLPDLQVIVMDSQWDKITRKKNPLCDACLEEQDDPDDIILTCVKCKTKVHCSCYGIEDKKTVELPWTCTKCKYLETQKNKKKIIRCIFCNFDKGVFKPSEDNDDIWCHILCVIWLYGPGFRDTKTRDRVIGIHDIDKGTKGICKLCGIKGKPCITCSFGNCRYNFHPICGKINGLDMKMTPQKNTDDLRILHYCPNHKDGKFIPKRSRNIGKKPEKKIDISSSDSDDSDEKSEGESQGSHPFGNPQVEVVGQQLRGIPHQRKTELNIKQVLDKKLNKNNNNNPGNTNSKDMIHHQALIILSYIFKGGVGKTTLANNLAGTLAKEGKIVLLIDADAQTNCTKFWMQLPADDTPLKYTTFQKDEKLPTLFSVNLPTKNPVNLNPHAIHNSIEKELQKNTKNRQILTIDQILGKLMSDEDIDPIPPLLKVNEDDYNGNLLLLPGSTKLREIRRQFEYNPPKSLIRSGHIRKWKKFLNLLIVTHKIEFVIIDLGPDVSGLTEMFYFTSDYIMPPLEFGLGAWEAVDSLLTDIIPSWLEAFKDAKDLQPAYLLPFLGCKFEIDKYHRKQQPGQTLEKVYWPLACSCRSVEQTVSCDLVTEQVKALYQPDAEGRMVIPFLKKLKTMPVSEEQGRTFDSLKEEHLNDYYQNIQWKQTMDPGGQGIFRTEVTTAKKAFQSLANLMIELLKRKKEKKKK